MQSPYLNFIYDLVNRFSSLQQQWRMNPLALGGSSGSAGGNGGPPGGFLGVLPQKRVASDTTESFLYTPSSGSAASLYDNLNRIRAWELPAHNFFATANTPPDARVSISSGSWYYADSTAPMVYTGGFSPYISAPSSGSRYDLLEISNSGTVGWIHGTESITPTEPAFPSQSSGSLPLYLILARSSGSVISQYDDGVNHYISQDLRPFVGGSGGSSSGSTPYSCRWHIDGALSVSSNAAGVFYLPADFVPTTAEAYLRTPNSSGSTIVDIQYSTDYSNWYSLFADANNRLTLSSGSSASRPTVVQPLHQGDLLKIDIVQVGVGGSTLSVNLIGNELGGSGGSGGHTIQDEGISLTQRPKLNFTGAGVAVTDDPTNSTTVVAVSSVPTTFATIAQAQAGTATNIAVDPSGLPLRVESTALIRQDGYGGNARGANAVDLQRGRVSASQVASGAGSSIIGGINNTASGKYSFSIGVGNTASGKYSHAEGLGNIAGGDFSSSSGSQNTASGKFSQAIGNQNTASNDYSVSIGGHNTSSGYHSAAIGYGNTASNYYSLAYGLASTASSQYGIALGLFAKADKDGQFSHSSIGFSSSGGWSAGMAQHSLIAPYAQTTNNTPSELKVGWVANKRITISAGVTWAFDILVSARRTDADNESAAYQFLGCIDNNSGTTALVGSVTKVVIAEDTPAWDCNVTADDTNDALIVTATGENGKTIRWLASVRLAEIAN